MRPFVLTCAVSCMLPCFVGAQINVSVCPHPAISNSMINKAEEETAFLFRAAGLQITWVPCGDFQVLSPEVRGSLFIVRVLAAPKERTVARGSLEHLGKALLADG